MIIENVKVKVGDVHNLNMAIKMLITTSKQISGRATFALNDTAKNCAKILNDFEPKRIAVFKKYCKYDKEGHIIFNELTEEEKKNNLPPSPALKDGKKSEDLENDLKKLIGSDVTLKIRKMHLDDFGSIVYDQSQNPMINIICDLMITEKENNLVVS